MAFESTLSGETADSQYEGLFKFQIMAYDSYQTSPSMLDKRACTINNIPLDKKEFSQVPVLRIFGKSHTGHTILVHIHNVFPYFYVPYLGSLQSSDHIHQGLVELKNSIEKQMWLSFQRKGKPSKNEVDEATEDYIDESFLEDPSHENTYLADLSLVRGTPFYGFHIGDKPMVKISLLSPKYTSRLSRLFLEKKVYSKIVQPFESHIPYTLQFLTDFNLFGCDWCSVEKLFWRAPIVVHNRSQMKSDTEDAESDCYDLNHLKITEELKEMLKMHVVKLGNMVNVLDRNVFQRIGNTLLEADLIPQWIKNREKIEERRLHHDFLEFFQRDEKSSRPEVLSHTKFLNSTNELLKDVMYQRKLRGLSEATARLFESDERNFNKTQWIEQAELDEMLRHCSVLSLQRLKNSKPSFENFVPKSDILSSFCTAFQSVGLLMFEPILGSHLEDRFSAKSFEGEDALQDLLTDNHSLESVESASSVVVEKPEDLAPEPGLAEAAEEESEVEDFNDSSDNEMEVQDFDQTIFGQTQRFKVPRVLERELDGISFDTEFPSSQLTHKSEPLVSRTPIFDPFAKQKDLQLYELNLNPPSSGGQFLQSFEDEFGMLQIEYCNPFYSDRKNYDIKPTVYGGKKFKFQCSDLDGLETYTKPTPFEASPYSGHSIWKYTEASPSFKEVDDWSARHQVISRSQMYKSQIAGPTPLQKYGFKYASAGEKVARRANNYNKLMTLTIELFVCTRDDFKPDPTKDAVQGIFWMFDSPHYPFDLGMSDSGVMLLSQGPVKEAENLLRCPVALFNDEERMVEELVSLVQFIDPDILAGYEVHASSWGYLIERFSNVFNVDLCARLSRVLYKNNNKSFDRWGYTHASAFRITGRHVLNLWRHLRNEVNLLRYTMENVVFHVLHQRIPRFSFQMLTAWFQSGDPNLRATVLNYYMKRTSLDLEIIDKLDLITKTTEESRLSGMDFYSVLYRGSQFKVESFLIRLLKAENFIPISPSRKQVFKQDPLQCIPLIMEPESAFYKSPLVVLDFQSLYPSLVIAYNYCYSTLLGFLQGYDPKKKQRVGVSDLELAPGTIALLEKYINISPNGMMFVKSQIRQSTLAKMLMELLDTRILVKTTMSKVEDDFELNKLYNSRQLALKLTANVTYGYTSATFSGRMPCSGIADAIVSSARETLNRAISEIEKEPKWGAKVVYGDTDSLFIYLPGKSKGQAFDIGNEMARHVTKLNPKPVKLKFEKVYHPCILLSKKRYVGFSYEYKDQKKPKFDAKGIETVRRDGIPAQQKIVEKALRILFTTKDLSKVKNYVQSEFLKIINKKVTIQDFCFAKEVRVGSYKDERYAPAGAHVSKKKMEQDKRDEPQYRERVPYVVIKGKPNERLRDRCVPPEFFIDNELTLHLELDDVYYITKVLIPPLERIFNLLGVNVKMWYQDLPRVIVYKKGASRDIFNKPGVEKAGVEIESFITSMNCVNCGEGLSETVSKLCQGCRRSELGTVLNLKTRLKQDEDKLRKVLMICRNCVQTNVPYGDTLMLSDTVTSSMQCISDDCSILYSRVKATRRLQGDRDKLTGALDELDW